MKFRKLMKNNVRNTVLTLCLSCVALPWGQPAWQGLGFSGLVHEETHPCGSSVEEIHSVCTVNNVETSYFTQLTICYLTTTFRCPPDILITSWSRCDQDVRRTSRRCH